MQNFRVGIVGASGYAGSELLRILAAHPQFSVEVVTAHSQSGELLADVHPHLRNAYPTLKTLSFADAVSGLESCDLVFIALPHGQAMDVVAKLKKCPCIIDLGGDFRLRSANAYQQWYGKEHSLAAQLAHWVYGLPECHCESIRNASRIANPGCYATAMALSLLPLAKAHLIDSPVTTIGLSGTSGAGRVPSDTLHFSHAHENVYAYRIGKHAHTAEVEQLLTDHAREVINLSFTPHVVPMVRGIHTTSVCSLRDTLSTAEISSLFRDFYEHAPFVSVVEQSPASKTVRGSNFVLIHAAVDERIGQVIVTAVLDNLVKGAAGQAVQNANIRFGLPETMGLSAESLYP
jgi:N-acetyl-gamma-glutamyl-phosphate reductase